MACASTSLAGPPYDAERQEPWQPPLDPALRRSLEVVVTGLSRQNLHLLADLLPRREKVMIRWDEPIRQEGLFTGSQVTLLLRDLFESYRTERFSLQSGALLPPGSLYHCMGRWVLRGASGQSQTLELHFSLQEDAGVWTIREMRQSR